MNPSELIGFAAGAISLFQAVRQLIEVRRVPNAHGVSPTTWLFAAAQCAMFGFFSLVHGLTAGMVANAMIGSCAVAIYFSLCWHKGLHRRLFSTLLVVLILPAPILINRYFSADVLGTAAALFSIIVWFPQTVHTLRSRDVRGLSASSIIAGISSSVLWIGYAALTRQWPLSVPSICALLAMFVTLISVLSSRSHNAGP